MSSEVDICNLALSHLGDTAEVHSIEPPDGSAQSFHCARWYKQALFELLEMHPWTFAVGRKTNLGGFTSDVEAWAFMYALPVNIIKPYRALPPSYTDEEKDEIKFKVEGDIIYSAAEIGTLLVILPVTNTAKFSPLFVEALATKLATKLLGPIRKVIGGTELTNLERIFNFKFALATGSNADIDNNQPEHTPGWIKAR